MELIINKNFKTNTIITNRTLQIAEAFGLGIDEEKEFNVYKDFKISINEGDIIYVTGDSGSGKSLLLNELKKKVEDCISMEDVIVNDNLTLIDSIGKDTNEALYYLSLVGLSDAFLCIRRFNELSDGQKYRYKLAKMLETNKSVLIADEFCSLLDRDTAKIIAFNYQKICRKFNKTLIVATTHIDLKEDLNPNVYIYKKYNDDIDITYEEVNVKKCSLYNQIKIEEGTIQDYYKLGKFHYRNGKFAGHFKTFKMLHNNDLIGVVCYSYPPLALKGRNTYTDRYKNSTSEIAKLINKELKIVSRIVIHPKYRGIGLATDLLKETMPLTNQKYIELLAVMGRFNPFAEKSGMIKVEYEESNKYKKIQNYLIQHGFDLFLCNSTSYTVDKIKSMNKDNRNILADMVIKKVKSVYTGISSNRGKAGKKGINEDSENIDDYILATLIKECLPKDRRYYIWENSEYIDGELQ